MRPCVLTEDVFIFVDAGPLMWVSYSYNLYRWQLVVRASRETINGRKSKTIFTKKKKLSSLAQISRIYRKI